VKSKLLALFIIVLEVLRLEVEEKDDTLAESAMPPSLSRKVDDPLPFPAPKSIEVYPEFADASSWFFP
jgi:hypothetical protein